MHNHSLEKSTRLKLRASQLKRWHEKMKKNKKYIFIIVLFFSLTGCGTFSGNFKFINESDKEIWVDRVVGFESEPPCGILIPQAHAGASMHRMKFPAAVTIYWSYNWSRGDQKTILNLSNVKPPQGDSEIVFIFNPDHEWYVITEDY